MATSRFEEHQFRLTVRFVQGYRYLDRAGEAMIKLEDALHTDWLPNDPAPAGGHMRNDTLGMMVAFNTEAVTVQQSEVVSFDHFRQEACIIIDVLRSVFQINRFHSPALMCTYQCPFGAGEEAAAEAKIKELGLIDESNRLEKGLGGKPESYHIVARAVVAKQWEQIPIPVSRRVEAKVIRQIEQKPIDTRVIRRATLLPEKQRDALLGANRLINMHPHIASLAAELNLETSLEGEIDFKEFSAFDFITTSHEWSLQAKREFTN